MTTTFYKTVWGEGAVNCEKSVEKLKELLNDPVNFTPQRTHEWYEMRKKVLTASCFYDICVTGGATSTRILNEKLFPDMFPRQEFIYSLPLFHGCRCESVANSYYEYITGTSIHNFGLIVSKKETYIAASPDGINNKGILVEFKCPYSRELIPGKVPLKYLYQIYGQLLSCELTRCDYVECIFKKQPTKETWLARKGIDKSILVFTHDIVEGVDDSKNWVAPFGCDLERMLDLAMQEVQLRLAKRTETERIQMYYITLTDFNLVPVTYDDEFVREYMLPNLKMTADKMKILKEPLKENMPKGKACKPPPLISAVEKNGKLTIVK